MPKAPWLLDSGDAELSSSDQVVEHITSSILAGRYVPGQRLIEADLTHALRVSRGPVREAFRRLDALGILTRTMHRGACVRTLDRTEAMHLLLAVEPLIGLTARLAAEQLALRPMTRDAGNFERKLQPYRDGQEDVGNPLVHRRHFYDVLVAMSGNTQLPSLFPTMRLHLLRLQVQSFFDPERSRRRHLDNYASIAKFVLAGEAKQAEKAMVAHNRRMRETIVVLPDAAFPNHCRAFHGTAAPDGHAAPHDCGAARSTY
jgi:DNA-binding GntR family transcriptional regulator